MSTQSILQFDLLDIKNNLDESLSCASNTMMLSIKFGMKQHSMDSKDIFLMNYLYDLINNDNNCYLLDDECSLEKINKLLLKYK